MEPEALRRRARMSQSGAEHEQSRVPGHDLDPDYIRALEHFPALSHQQIHDAVEAMNPGAMHRAADSWITIADSIFGALTTLHATIQTTLSEALSGEMAEAADHSARRFITEATTTAEITQSTGHRILAAAYGAEALRKTVPPPAPHASPNAREELRQMALAALDANYTPIYPPSGAHIPAFFTVMTPGGGVAIENAGGTAESVPDIEAPDTGWAHAAPAPEVPASADVAERPGQLPSITPATTDPAAAHGIPTSAAAVADTGNLAGQTPNRAGWGGGQTYTPHPDAIETSPATFDPGDTPPSPTGQPTPTAKPATEWPRATLVSPTPDGIVPDPGRSYPAPPNLESPTGPRTSIRTPAPDSPGSGLPGGMFAPTNRSATDSDTLHHSPNWLIRNRQDELLGTPLPYVPPTIGAEILAARNDLARPHDDPA
ncbi:hypothetical protein [Nocardia heshunensis]